MMETDRKSGALDFLVLALSIYVLLALCIDTLFKLPHEVSQILHLADAGICFIFLGDFLYRFFSASSKLAYLKWGWIDLLSSIPMLDIFRVGRVFRVIRVLRILRGVRATKYLISYVFKNRAKGAFASVATVSIILLVFSAIAILNVENLPGSNIETAEDALWWAFVTITTVGYGDTFPISMEGRIIAGVLMTAGVGLFGTFTGLVASWFIEEDTEDTEEAIIAEIRALRAEVAELKAQHASSDELHEALEDRVLAH